MAKETITQPPIHAATDVAVVQVAEDSTTVLRLRVLGQNAIVQDCWNCGPLIGAEAPGKPSASIKRIRERLGTPMATTLVFNSGTVSSFVQRAPVSTEGSIRAHVQQALLQSQKTDLSKCIWSITPMSYRLDDQRGLSEALSNKVNVLISAAPKGVIQPLTSAFEKEGCPVGQTLFPVPSLIKAFQQFGGAAFEGQMIALLHVRQGNYSLAFYRSGALVSYAESKGEGSDVVADVRNHIESFQGRYKTSLRCVFVSSDSLNDQQLVDALKTAGSYARPWNACRKLTISPTANGELSFETGTRFNILAGGVCSAIEAASKPAGVPDGEDDDEIDPATDILLLARPFAIAACILLVPLLWLLYQNTVAAEHVRSAQSYLGIEQKQFEQNRRSAGNLHEKLADLELFSKSRRRWPQLIMELRSIAVSGIELLQVKASDTVTLAESNPFQSAASMPARKSQGYLVLEARNEAGLVALESFMQSVKNATQLRSVINKKRPPRLLNNVVLGSASEELPEKTLFAVEYLLDEKSF